MKRSLLNCTLITVFSMCSCLLYASNIPFLSEQAEVSMLSCTPGDETYSTFGHAAIRINDPLLEIDLVYNYGTYDFNTPNFYVKFIRRELDFVVSREHYYMFEKEYVKDNRAATEQILNLTQEQKQNVFETLETNYLPENRHYRYDYFFDNCATRVRDIINAGLDNKIAWGYGSIEEGQTFRQLIDPYISHDAWLDFGIGLGLGSPTDRVAESVEYMFLPPHMCTIFADSKLGTDGTPLVKSQKILFDTSDGIVHPILPFWQHPLFVFWTLFAITLLITIMNLRKLQVWWWFDAILMLFTGIVGFLVFFLWFFTSHGVTENNFNILWALPTNILIIFFFIPRKKPAFVRYYFLLTAILSFGVSAIWWIGPQTFHPAAFPIALTVLMRSLTIFWVQTKKTKILTQ